MGCYRPHSCARHRSGLCCHSTSRGRFSTPHWPRRTNQSKTNFLADYYNHHHPLLMLHLARTANAVAGFTDRQGAVELGRSLAVLAGGLAIFATFLLARKVLPATVALAACLATSVVPAMTVHARYFKEDIFALPFILFSLVALIETLKTPTRMRGLLLGTAIGLAASAKFIAAITLPFAVAVLLIASWGKEDWQIRLRLAGLITIAAVGILALVELPAIWNLSVFGSSLSDNLDRVNRGDGIPLPITLTYGIFHLLGEPAAEPRPTTFDTGTAWSRDALARATSAATADLHYRLLRTPLVCGSRVLALKAIPQF